MADNQEQDIRLGILNSLLNTPHRDLRQIHQVHQSFIDQDPVFYGRLAAWYNQKGEVRDHKEMFIVMLTMSMFPGHRDVGLALARELPPYQLRRVVDFINGYNMSVRPAAAAASTARPAARVRGQRTPRPAGTTAVVRPPAEKIHVGLDKRLPVSLKTEIERYMREREAEPLWFDSCILGSRKHMKRLYVLAGVKPSDRAREIVFEDKPPADSALQSLKDLAKLKDPTEQARLIIERKIPYRIASTVVEQMTPVVLLALIEVMSPQELMNNLSSLKKRGAFDNIDLKNRINQKLEEAKTSKRVSAMKMDKAAEGMDEETKKALEVVADTQVKSRGQLKARTAIFVDKSMSQQTSIEIGKRIASMISAVALSELYVYVFDTEPREITVQGKDMASWERAFAGTKANGGTNAGCCFASLARSKRLIDLAMIIKEGGENEAKFPVHFQNYVRDMGVTPALQMVHIPGDPDKLSGLCAAAGISMDKWEFRGDYTTLPNLIPIVTQVSKLDLVMEIMEFELPKRKAA